MIKCVKCAKKHAKIQIKTGNLNQLLFFNINPGAI